MWKQRESTLERSACVTAKAGSLGLQANGHKYGDIHTIVYFFLCLRTAWCVRRFLKITAPILELTGTNWVCLCDCWSSITWSWTEKESKRICICFVLWMRCERLLGTAGSSVIPFLILELGLSERWDTSEEKLCSQVMHLEDRSCICAELLLVGWRREKFSLMDYQQKHWNMNAFSTSTRDD